MRFLQHVSVVAFLMTAAAAAQPCLAMMDIETVSKARAKELGIEIRSKPAGPDAAWIELEFAAAGALKNYERVNLEIAEGGKPLSSFTLKEEKSKPGHIVVSFTAAPTQLAKITFRVVTGTPMNYTGHDLAVKEFVEPEKAAAVTPEESAQFVAAVRKAFEMRDASALTALTNWDRVPEKVKQTTEASYVALLAEKEAVFDFELVEPDRKFIERDRTEEGVTSRANLPIIKQLNIKAIGVADKKTLMMICFAVGQKDGKLMLAGSAPVK